MSARARVTPSGVLKEPSQYVTFDPGDDAQGCDEVFWEDPRYFQPRRGPNGEARHWGLFPWKDGIEWIEGYDIFSRWTRIFRTYDFKGKLCPEEQFVLCRMAIKLMDLEEMDVEELKACDYTLYIKTENMPKLPGSEADRLWRRIRVSGGLTLSVFADKVLTPLFGFIRNLHAHVFHDLLDGALFGPEGCDAIDMMHRHATGYRYLPDDEWQIAHILQAKGEATLWQYDFGDNWYFHITVEDIAPAQASTGAVTVLGGSGTHCPQDLTPVKWAELLAAADRSTVRVPEALRQLFQSQNYAHTPFSAAYSLEHFSAGDTQRALAAALDSPASVRSMSKQFAAMLDGSDRTPRAHDAPDTLKRGQQIVATEVLDAEGKPTGVFLEEGVAKSRRDHPDTTACANCGSPNNLKVCSGCKKKYFCSRSCQRVSWAQGHKKECKAMKA
ncbi:zf-MYND domain-containing protein [Phanerochaete sordida]|uniref:Zf-MYND domain-containing protein n=1 Tax=Phanerochaete sordida TaxID=48140 RepID=A0A9P3GDF0_9APHY|nr:zf-MYND domain-containing protein [Phanerochaete sordida]